MLPRLKRFSAPGLLVAVRGYQLRVVSFSSVSGMTSQVPPAVTMVPISFLEWQRADSKAAMDALLATTKVTTDTQRAALDDAKATLDAQRTDAKVTLDVQCALYSALVLSSALEVAAAKRDADVARARANVTRGKITARVLVEESVADVWRTWQTLGLEEKRNSGAKNQPSTVTQQLADLLDFPGVKAYLQVAEEDNGLARGVLGKSALVLYPALCTPLHSRGVGGKVPSLPPQVFDAIGENGLIAFAALVALSGRNVGLYCPVSNHAVKVVLRAPPKNSVTITVEKVRDSPKQGDVESSVELDLP
jgi:hypothetical protein